MRLAHTKRMRPSHWIVFICFGASRVKAPFPPSILLLYFVLRVADFLIMLFRRLFSASSREHHSACNNPLLIVYHAPLGARHKILEHRCTKNEPRARLSQTKHKHTHTRALLLQTFTTNTILLVHEQTQNCAVNK